jgi:hypothetical protein
VQLALLVVLLLAGAVAVGRSVARWREYRHVEAVCAAADRRDWQAVLADPRPLAPTVAQLREADCRCVALLATGRGGECYAVLEDLLSSRQGADWLPRLSTTLAMIEHRRARGDLGGAAELARRTALLYPDQPGLLFLEGVLTAQASSPAAAIAAVDERLRALGDEPTANALRRMLAHEAAEVADYEASLRALGDEPPARQEDRDQWFQQRMVSLARAGRIREMSDTGRRWGADPGRAARSFGIYAYVLSITQQRDGAEGLPVLALLASAISRGDEMDDPALLEVLYVRYVGTLAVAGLEKQALRAYDEAFEKFGKVGSIDRGDLTRTVGEPEVALGSAGGADVEVRVSRPRPGWRLLLSPDATAARDADWVEQPVPPSGVVRLQRTPDTWPVRWVLRDDAAQVLGSGAVWPTAGGLATAVAEPREPVPAQPPARLLQRRASGRSRLFVVILDCGEWRLVQHGRARGELPVFDALIRGGRTAVVSSVPPFTASAMESLVHPGAGGVDGLMAMLHHLGTELAGLSFVTANPAAPIGWLLPEGASFFSAMGAGDLRAANLLRSYGRMQLGRHGQVWGPAGATSLLQPRGGRDLRPEDGPLTRVEDADDKKLLGEVAGDFDDAVRIAEHDSADLVLLRVAAFDLLTHGSFAETAKAGQDDGAPLLFAVYRYVDGRIGELYQALDGNDVLVVMSDHGANTALEHHRDALFVAAGGGVVPGRVPGAPELRGVPRMIADFFAVPTDWPATGIDLPRQGPAAAAEPAASAAAGPASP